MCGVAGIMRFDGMPVEPEVLRAMADQLDHRPLTRPDSGPKGLVEKPVFESDVLRDT
jgi:hypothetical protein